LLVANDLYGEIFVWFVAAEYAQHLEKGLLEDLLGLLARPAEPAGKRENGAENRR
jgi:hypothetical protein